jgi:hypothetical protein
VQEVIGREQWRDFVKEFNHRNEMRPTRLEVLGQGIGVEEEERLLPLTGISLEENVRDMPRVEITLGGETAKEERHLTHTISRVRSIIRKVGVDVREDALLIEDEDGIKTLLVFETLPELAPAD